MFRILLLLLIIIPAAEIGILIWSGNTFGIPITILLIIATGIIGAWLARREGMETVKLAQIQLGNAQVPSDVLLDGVCILVGGTLLLTPGFITDTLGFLLLIPYTRSIFKIGIRRLIQKKIDSGQFTFTIRR
ncbi:FxsA family protein [Pseudalkalibacillus berkeleyi]|uniref:Membrane protein FxsA n=1 Tax=Pseudalkalibacillus berkeleyi TaxID=1069813 RepID=A0ABS9H2Y3_9BACL|nr:FxsA family protein [Pseudalkalibacillus berkeleyi]MCF6138202.1 membrane protein FxsA [Pseudalkalibacillus berkeleyi]